MAVDIVYSVSILVAFVESTGIMERELIDIVFIVNFFSARGFSRGVRTEKKRL